MSNPIHLRLAQRSDIPSIARIANAANAQSALHRRIALHQDEYPTDYYHWRLQTIRLRFATPNLRNVVAEDSQTGEILGVASWMVEGRDTALHQRWSGESSWIDWVEDKLIRSEQAYFRYVMDRSVDYKFLDRFLAIMQGSDRAARPACLHPHLIVVDPDAQGRGVGKKLIDWGKELAMREELPIYLESNLEATRFYEKAGFVKLGDELVIRADGSEPFHLPAYVWEGKEREGRWLERELAEGGKGGWKWRADILKS